MFEFLQLLADTFWSPNVWLPKGYTWENFNKQANWNDLWTYPIIMAIATVFVRYNILNKFVYGPIATFCGMKDIKYRPVTPNKTLEKLYSKYKISPPKAELQLCSKEVDMTGRQVERWLRHRQAVTKVTKHTKFTECCWQLTYYTFSFSYGLWVMLDKPWLYDLKKCWYDYPNHPVTTDIWWYYMISLTFYWSMVITHFLDAKRKDFWQMLIHHFVTIFLIVLSWTCIFHRVGTIVLILHDAADIPLHAAKLLIYLKKKAVCDATFAFFAITWLVTRDGIYPFCVIRNTLFDALEIIPIFPVYYIFNSLLIALMILHIYWTYFIFRIVAKKLMKGQIEDDRSSSSDYVQSENEKSS